MVTRVVFLGTPEFAVPSLEALFEAEDGGDGLQVVAVVTQPDRPVGRGRRLTPPPVKRVAEARGLPVYQPKSLRRNPEAVDFFRRYKPTLLVVAAFGQFLPAEIFELPPYGALNVHASLLPRFRGAAPVSRAVMAGETETGMTIMKIDAGMDTGDILAQAAVPIGPDQTAGELEKVLAVEGARLLVRTLPPYLAGEIQGRPQDADLADYAPRLSKEEGRLDWPLPAVELHNRIRGLNPWPGAWTRFREETLKVWRSRLPEETTGGGESPGRCLSWSPEGVRVSCGEASELLLLEVQRESRRTMSARDWAVGCRLRPGERFS